MERKRRKIEREREKEMGTLGDTEKYQEGEKMRGERVGEKKRETKTSISFAKAGNRVRQ